MWVSVRVFDTLFVWVSALGLIWFTGDCGAFLHHLHVYLNVRIYYFDDFDDTGHFFSFQITLGFPNGARYHKHV